MLSAFSMMIKLIHLAEIISKYNLLAIPVTDHEMKMGRYGGD
jgi:Mg/Co/Ni transporter MgtE